MHTVDTSKLNLRTDLIIDRDLGSEISIKEKEVITQKDNNYMYTTIYFEDISDKDNYKKVQDTFIKELKKYIKKNKEDKFLVIGLGNNNSTPDSLGPKTIDNILTTRHLYLLGDVDNNYSNVSKFKPSVTGETGIETQVLIKNVISSINPTKVLIIDSLKASKTERLNHIIQITNSGIHPGSGINNNRGEISKKTTGVEIIAIGVPTVVDIKTILENILKEEVQLNENLIVTPTNIDYTIDKLSLLIGNGINKTLHNDLKRQNNYK